MNDTTSDLLRVNVGHYIVLSTNIQKNEYYNSHFVRLEWRVEAAKFAYVLVGAQNEW